MQSRTILVIMNHWIELSRKNFHYNVHQVGRLARDKAVAFVIKGNAYGHGFQESITLAREAHSISWICVAGIQEGVAARQCGWDKDILVMAYHDADYRYIIEYNLALAVYTYEQLEMLSRVAQQHTRMLRVHIKVDVGMSRLGVAPDEVRRYAQHIQQTSLLHLEGLFTHFSDTQNRDITLHEQQIHTFERVTAELEQAGIIIPLVHSVASGTLHESSQSDMVRVGTAIYGMWKSPVQKERFHNHITDIDFKPVLALYARLIKTISEQGKLYGIIGVGFEQMPFYPLRGTYVRISEQVVPVLQVNQSTMLISLEDNYPLGTVVQIIGESNFFTVDALAKQRDVIPNEFLATLCAQMPRVIV